MLLTWRTGGPLGVSQGHCCGEIESFLKSVKLRWSFVSKHGGICDGCVNNKPRGIYSASLANLVLICFDYPGSHVMANFHQVRGVGTNF